jgi:hypothetical protein
MPNGGVGSAAKVLQANEQMLDRGGSLLPMQSIDMAQASLTHPVQASGSGAAWSTENITRGTSTSIRDEEEFGMHRQNIFNLNTPYNFSG